MAIYDAGDKLFQPVFFGYNVYNSSAVNGWKLYRPGTVAKDTCSGWDGSNLRYTPNVAGYYHLFYNHRHGNGGHDAYRLEIKVVNGGGAHAVESTGDGTSGSLSCIAYFDGSSYYAEFKNYHNNDAHNCSTDEREVNAGAYRLMGM